MSLTSVHESKCLKYTNRSIESVYATARQCAAEMQSLSETHAATATLTHERDRERQRERERERERENEVTLKTYCNEASKVPYFTDLNDELQAYYEMIEKLAV